MLCLSFFFLFVGYLFCPTTGDQILCFITSVRFHTPPSSTPTCPPLSPALTSFELLGASAFVTVPICRLIFSRPLGQTAPYGASLPPKTVPAVSLLIIFTDQCWNSTTLSIFPKMASTGPCLLFSSQLSDFLSNFAIQPRTTGMGGQFRTAPVSTTHLLDHDFPRLPGHFFVPTNPSPPPHGLLELPTPRRTGTCSFMRFFVRFTS